MSKKINQIINDFKKRAKKSGKKPLEIAAEEIIYLQDQYDIFKFEKDNNSFGDSKSYQGAEQPSLFFELDDKTINKFPISSKNKKFLKRYRDLNYDKDDFAEELEIKPNSVYRRMKRITKKIYSSKKYSNYEDNL